MSGLREALVNGLTHYNFCFAEIHASEPSIAMPEEVELVADAVLRVLAEHGDTQQVREQVTRTLRKHAQKYPGRGASGYCRCDEWHDEDHQAREVMAVVARIVAARDAATERAERAEQSRDKLRASGEQHLTDLMTVADKNLDRAERAEGDLAAAQQQLDQVRDVLARDGQTPLTRLVKAQAILDAGRERGDK